MLTSICTSFSYLKVTFHKQWSLPRVYISVQITLPLLAWLCPIKGHLSATPKIVINIIIELAKMTLIIINMQRILLHSGYASFTFRLEIFDKYAILLLLDNVWQQTLEFTCAKSWIRWFPRSHIIIYHLYVFTLLYFVFAQKCHIHLQNEYL